MATSFTQHTARSPRTIRWLFPAVLRIWHHSSLRNVFTALKRRPSHPGHLAISPALENHSFSLYVYHFPILDTSHECSDRAHGAPWRARLTRRNGSGFERWSVSSGLRRRIAASHRVDVAHFTHSSVDGYFAFLLFGYYK